VLFNAFECVFGQFEELKQLKIVDLFVKKSVFAKILVKNSACKKNAFLLLFFTRSIFFTNPDFEYFRVKNL